MVVIDKKKVVTKENPQKNNNIASLPSLIQVKNDREYYPLKVRARFSVPVEMLVSPTHMEKAYNAASAKFTLCFLSSSKPIKNLPVPLALVSTPNPKVDSNPSWVMGSLPLYLDIMISAVFVGALCMSNLMAFPEALTCTGSSGY